MPRYYGPLNGNAPYADSPLHDAYRKRGPADLTKPLQWYDDAEWRDLETIAVRGNIAWVLQAYIYPNDDGFFISPEHVKIRNKPAQASTNISKQCP